jgi:hypothetical protein
MIDILEDTPDTPEWIQELFNRRIAVNRYYDKTSPADAKPGQAWALKLPKHLVDPITKMSVMPVVFLQGWSDAREMEADEGSWYAFLCLSQEPESDHPIKDGEIKPWISAKELTGRDELLSDPPIDFQAEWILPRHPVYVKPEWLGRCVADMQQSAAIKAYNHGIDFMFMSERDSPNVSETHRKNKFAGLSPYELANFIRDCLKL